MKAVILIHASFEKPGAIQTWCDHHGIAVSEVHSYKGEKSPEIDAFDILFVMGGPQSPREFIQYPYLSDEIELIKASIQANKFVFGVCLGVQLIAEALGALTERSPKREVGVFPISLTSHGTLDPLFESFPDIFDVAHWHQDMPGLPDEAVVLATSPGCPRQIVRFNQRTLGTQCHLELTRELVKEMANHCQNDLNHGSYIQRLEDFVNADFDTINKKLYKLLDRFIDPKLEK